MVCYKLSFIHLNIYEKNITKRKTKKSIKNIITEIKSQSQCKKSPFSFYFYNKSYFIKSFKSNISLFKPLFLYISSSKTPYSSSTFSYYSYCASNFFPIEINILSNFFIYDYWLLIFYDKQIIYWLEIFKFWLSYLAGCCFLNEN